jgi:hypothetical protein
MPDLHLRLEADDTDEIMIREPLGEREALAMLREAEITAAKLVPWGSNYTFAIGLTDARGIDHLGIYKPQAGERPLWDFPTGTLFAREYASYLLSRWLGWNLVPPTVIRDGPNGVGSVQLYIEPTSNQMDEHAFWGRITPEIERMVMFDHIANNADRKIGHCLLDTRGKIWGIDHGLTFNVDPKLRTVLWQYSGKGISPGVLADLHRLAREADDLLAELGEVIASDEVKAMQQRVTRLLARGTYPRLDPYSNVPYGWW